MSSLPKYIGRFAPSPTGPLHFGSLVAALASYLDAKYHKGKWLVRMEDIDPPREQAGAADHILQTLEDHGLYWDESVLYQSSRLSDYQNAISDLIKNDTAYPCSCSRLQLKDHPIYPGTCRKQPPSNDQDTAIRLIAKSVEVKFQDAIQGWQSVQMAEDIGDFVIRRKDGLIAYQLAVALDDIAQNITCVVRGSDLLDSTLRQIYIMQLLKLAPPEYSHIPVIIDSQGQKLSKQSYAPALVKQNASSNLLSALKVLNQQPPNALTGTSVTDILHWACENWQMTNIPRKPEISE